MHRRLPRSTILATLAAAAAAGCAQTRTYTVATNPPDATLRVNGRDVDRRQPTLTLAFSSPEQTYSLVASRPGFQDASVPVKLDTPPGRLNLDLQPRRKPITISVEPAPARLSVDGQPIALDNVSSAGAELVFRLDASLRPRPYTLRAERDGFAPAEIRVDFNESRAQYTLRLAPLVKDLTISSDPPGATLSFDDQPIGVAPQTLRGQPFAYDARTEKFVPRAITATKPGYPPARLEIAWDDGQTAYTIALPPYQKQARIVTEPRDARVVIDGKELPIGRDGARVVTLKFPPIDESGTLATVPLSASVSHPNEIWKPFATTLAYDNGRPNYNLKLEEILTRDVPARAVRFGFKDGRWSPTIAEAKTLAFKDTNDQATVARVTDLPAGSQVDSFAVSPDGQSIVYALLDAASDRPRSRLYLLPLDGHAATALTDGRSLDVTPTFDPAGRNVVFSSDRGGGPMQVWSLPIDGSAGVTRLTSGAADQLFPTLDTAAKPRVFFEALVPTLDAPRVYSTQAGTTFETDLTSVGGTQPKLSPRDDSVVFISPSKPTGDARPAGDVIRVSDRGGVVTNLTNAPDAAFREPAWSPDATRLAVSLQRPATQPSRPPQSDIATLPASGGKPTVVTNNDALDDQPAWSPTGDAIYFRSNRGGKWDVWRIDVK